MPPRRPVFWLLGCFTFVVSLTIHEFAEAAVSAPDDPSASPPWSQQEPETPAPPQELAETVTVTATRFPTPVADVGSSVSVITAEQIRTAGAHWLPECSRRYDRSQRAAGNPYQRFSAWSTVPAHVGSD